jgi:hypothetical protein
MSESYAGRMFEAITTLSDNERPREDLRAISLMAWELTNPGAYPGLDEIVVAMELFDDETGAIEEESFAA